MKALLYLAARLYPAAWRRRYGVEYRALLEQTTPTARNIVNVALGGAVMQARSMSPAVLAIAFGAVGLIAAGFVARTTSHRVESTGTLSIQAGAAANQDAAGLDATLLGLAERALSDDSMKSLAVRTEIHTSERHDIMQEQTTRRLVTASSNLRGDIRVALISPGRLEVSYASDDAGRSREVTDAIMGRFIAASLDERLSGRSTLPMTLRVLDAAGVPHSAVKPQRVALASAGGLGAGAVLGLLVGMVRQRPLTRP